MFNQIKVLEKIVFSQFQDMSSFMSRYNYNQVRITITKYRYTDIITHLKIL